MNYYSLDILKEARKKITTFNFLSVKNLAWMPIVLLLVIIIILWPINPQTYFDPPYLMLELNIVFSLLVSLLIAYLLAKSFLVNSSVGILIIISGVLAWGSAAVVGLLISHGDDNILITFHNVCVCYSSLCFLIGSLVLLYKPNKLLKMSGFWIAFVTLATIGVIIFISIASIAGWIPQFFIPESGGTAVRWVILGLAEIMFVVAAYLLSSINIDSSSQFTRWYRLGLLMIAVGLFGIMLEKVHGNALSWAGRTAQLSSGIYFLFAAFASVRESNVWGMPLKKALLANEKKLAEIYNSMSDGLAIHKIIYDERGEAINYIIVDVNPAYEKITNKKRSDVISKKATDAYDTKEAPYLNIYSKVAQTGKGTTFETYFAPMNKYFMISVFSPGKGEFVTIFQDETMLKRAQEITRNARDRFHLALSKMTFATLLINENGEVEFANQAFCNIFNLKKSPTELKKQTSDQILKKIRPSYYNPSKAISHIKDIVSRGLLIQDEEVPMVGNRTFLRDFIPIHLKNNKLSRLWIHKDITTRKHAELQLKESEDRFRTVAETTPVLICITRIKDSIVIFTNEVNNKAFGLPGSKIIGTKGPDYYCDPNDRIKMIDLLKQNGIVDNYQVKVKRNDGTPFWIMTSIRPIIYNGDACLIGASIDVTEQKRAEEAKNNFISIMSHELRNPLASILSNIELIDLYKNTKNKTKIDSDKNITDSLGAIKRQTKNMSGILDDLLDMSRIVQGTINLKKERTNLNMVIKSAVNALNYLIELQNHKLIIDLPSPPLYLLADPIRLEQIITNLLSNAIKYTPRDGRIFIKLKQIGNNVEISIKDTGVGIPEGDRERIFELFTHTAKSFVETKGDFGIGLKITKDLVNLHSGSIEVKSDGINKGSEFIVRLPIFSENFKKETTKVKKEISNSNSKGRKILVVDDNVDITNSLTQILKHYGHEVKATNSGFSAIRIAKKFKPEIAILDIGMPLLNGYELAKKLKETPEGNNLTLIALTGYGQNEDKIQTQKAGFKYHLVKPVTIDDLNKVIRSCTKTTRKFHFDIKQSY